MFFFIEEIVEHNGEAEKVRIGTFNMWQNRDLAVQKYCKGKKVNVFPKSPDFFRIK